MKTFKEYIVENSNKLYFVGKTLWLAYDESSGFTSQVFHDTSYLTNKPSDKNYDAIVNMINKSISSLKTKENSNYYFLEVPFYTEDSELDIWGGSRKPKQVIYMTLNKSGTLALTIFKSKSEANSWFKS